MFSVKCYTYFTIIRHIAVSKIIAYCAAITWPASDVYYSIHLHAEKHKFDIENKRGYNMVNFKKISRRFALGGLGQNLIYVLMSAGFLFYFTEAAGFTGATIGTLLLVVRIYALIAEPIIAIIIEKTNTRWGKYRPYITVFPPIISLLFVALFWSPPLDQGTHLIYIYAVTILFWTAYAFFDISFWSMVPSITKVEDKRIKLLTLCKLAIMFAAFGLGIAQMPLVKWLGNNDYSEGFFLLSIILAVIFTICGLLLAQSLNFMNNKTEEGQAIPVAKANPVKGLQMLKALLANKPLIIIILAKLAIYIPVTLKGNISIYFYKYNLGNDILSSYASMVSLPITLILVAFTPKLIKKFSDKKVMLAIVLVHTVLSFIYIVNTDAPIFYIAIDGFSNAAMGVYSLIITNMVASTVEYGDWKTGVRMESIIFSANTISSKLATGISAAIAGWVLSGIGYMPGLTQSEATLNALHQIMVWVPVIGCAIGGILLFKYNLTSRMYSEIVTDIEKRNQERG